MMKTVLILRWKAIQVADWAALTANDDLDLNLEMCSAGRVKPHDAQIGNDIAAAVAVHDIQQTLAAPLMST